MSRRSGTKSAKADFVETFAVGFGAMAPLPVCVIALTALAGPAGFLLGLLLVLWGALVGVHVVAAVRDGAMLYANAKASKAWTQQ